MHTGLPGLRVNDSLHRMFYASFASQHRICGCPRGLISRRRIYPFLVGPFVSFLLHTPLTTSREISRLVFGDLILRVVYLPEFSDPFAADVIVCDRSFETFDLGGFTSGFTVVALTAPRKFFLLFFPIALSTGRALAAVVLSFATSSQAATLLALTGREVLFLVLHSAILKPDLHLLLRQLKVGRDLDTTQPRQVHIRGEFTLQLQQLCAGECCADALRAVADGDRGLRRRCRRTVARWRLVRR